MNGTIVIDGSWDSDLVDEPVVLQIESGLVVDVKGGTAAAQIRQTFGEAAKRLKSKDQENVWTIAEFGFGMNPNARTAGNVLEDENEWERLTFPLATTPPGRVGSVGIQISGCSKPAFGWMRCSCLKKASSWRIETSIAEVLLAADRTESPVRVQTDTAASAVNA